MLKIAFIALAFALSPLVQAQTPVSVWGQVRRRDLCDIRRFN